MKSHVCKFTVVLFLLSYTACLSAQINGKILDAKTGQPLSGANIYSDKGVSITMSDEKGEFIIKDGELLQGIDTICISFVGYLTKRFPVRDLLKKKNSISLEEAPIELEEVTAYGVRKFYLRVPYTQISSMPVPLYSFAMVPCGNKLYVTGGDRSQVKPPTDYDLTASGGLPTGFIYEKYSNRIYIYDITSNTWTVSGQKLRERAYHSALYNDGKIYIMGGKRFSTNRKIEYLDETVEIYNIHQDTLLTDPVNPHQAASAAAFIYDNELIVFGGSTYQAENGWQKYSDKIHMLDLKKGIWYKVGKMPLGMETNGILMGHTVFLFGGYRQRPLSAILTYDLTTGIWKNRGNLWFSISKAAMTRGGDKVYILENGVIQVYNLCSNEVKAYQIDLNLRASGLYCTENKLIIVGGCTEDMDGKLGDAGIYEVQLSDFERTELHLINREK